MAKDNELIVTVKLAHAAQGDVGHTIEALCAQLGKPRATVVRELLEGALTEKPIDERIAALAHENDGHRIELATLHAQMDAVVPALKSAKANMDAAKETIQHWEARYHAAETAAIENGYFAERWRANARFYACLAPGGPLVCLLFLAIRDGVQANGAQIANTLAFSLLIGNAIRLRLAPVRIPHP